MVLEKKLTELQTPFAG